MLAVALAGLAGALAVAGAWEALAAVEQAAPARVIGRLARAAGRRATRGARADRARAPAAGARRRRRAAGRRLAAWPGPSPGAACAAGGPLGGRPARARAARALARRARARRARRCAGAGRRARRRPRGARRAGGGGARAACRAPPARELRAARPRAGARRAHRGRPRAPARARAARPRGTRIVAAILLQRDAGGDLAGLLRSIAAGLEEAARVEADARSATAQARFTGVARRAAARPAPPCWPSWPTPATSLALLRAPLAPWLLGAAAVCQLVACVLINRIARVGEPVRRGRVHAALRARRVAGASCAASRGSPPSSAGIVELAAAGCGRGRAGAPAPARACPRRWRAWAGAPACRRRRATSRAGSMRRGRRRRCRSPR